MNMRIDHSCTQWGSEAITNSIVGEMPGYDSASKNMFEQALEERCMPRMMVFNEFSRGLATDHILCARELTGPLSSCRVCTDIFVGDRYLCSVPLEIDRAKFYEDNGHWVIYIVTANRMKFLSAFHFKINDWLHPISPREFEGVKSAVSYQNFGREYCESRRNVKKCGAPTRTLLHTLFGQYAAFYVSDNNSNVASDAEPKYVFRDEKLCLYMQLLLPERPTRKKYQSFEDLTILVRYSC